MGAKEDIGTLMKSIKGMFGPLETQVQDPDPSHPWALTYDDQMDYYRHLYTEHGMFHQPAPPAPSAAPTDTAIIHPSDKNNPVALPTPVIATNNTESIYKQWKDPPAPVYVQKTVVEVPPSTGITQFQNEFDEPSAGGPSLPVDRKVIYALAAVGLAYYFYKKQ